MLMRRLHLLTLVFGSVCMLAGAAQADLVGLWQFDADVSPQPDASGNGHVGELVGDVEWVNDGERGGVMEFDGDDDYLDVEDTDMLSIVGDMTMAVWFNPFDLVTFRSIMGKTGDTSLNHPAPYDFYTVPDSGILRSYFGNGDTQGGSAFVDSFDPIEPETWQHIAVTVTEDGEVMQYLNGEDNTDGIDVSGTLREDLDQNLFIGSPDLFVDMFGRMDDVALFDEVLTQEQVQTIMDGDFSAFGVGGETRLQAGDADQDYDFDQIDLVQVQIAGKYLEDEAATWGDGDWDGAPGGTQGSPPAGDGRFNQLDIIGAVSNGLYLTGSYAAIVPGGRGGDAQTSIVYNPGSGELSVDAPNGVELTSINIDSAAGIFTGDAAANLGGSFDNDSDDNIFKATFGSSFGSLSFGNVAQTALSEDFVLNDLTVVGSLNGGGDLGNVDLVYVPEPTTAVLMLLAVFGLVGARRR